MTVNKFTITSGDDTFTFIRVNETINEFYLYVLPNDASKNGFFMNQDNDGKWQIANKVLVLKEILQIEDKLSNMVEDHLRKKISSK